MIIAGIACDALFEFTFISGRSYKSFYPILCQSWEVCPSFILTCRGLNTPYSALIREVALQLLHAHVRE